MSLSLIPQVMAATSAEKNPDVLGGAVTVATNVLIIIAILVVFLILARFVIGRIVRAIRYA